MAGITATPDVAAMAKRAADVMSAQNMVATPQGGSVTAPVSQLVPSTFLANRTDQLAQVAAQAAHNVSAWQPSGQQALASSAAFVDNLNAQKAAAAAAYNQAEHGSPSGGADPMADFVRGNTQFAQQLGISDEAALAAAQQYAQGRSYAGSAYQPHAIMQEGHVEYRNGIPGIYVKYETAAGASTEWTPLQ